jgi:MFS family permease
MSSPSPRTRLLATLFTAQVLGSTGHTMTLAVGGIMAAEITATNLWVGLPVAVASLGTALGSWPMSQLMARTGRRRPGLAFGYALAMLGATISMGGYGLRSFPVFLLGMVLFGAGHTSNLLARYAAVDASSGVERGRVMGFIVWGSTAGSILGPNLMGLAVEFGWRLGLSASASAFLISVVSYGLASILTHAFLRPDPLTLARQREGSTRGTHLEAPARALAAILSDMRVRLAIATLVVGQLVMIGTTSTSPVYLHDQGHSVGIIGIGVAMHLGGMYVSSPLSGWLSDRFGRIPVIVAGAFLLLAAVLFAGFVPGDRPGLVIAGLFLNGIGWNMAFVSGSALLTDALSTTERASIQGLADLMLGLSGALGSAAGGMILGAWGFVMLNTLGAVCVIGPLVAAWLATNAAARQRPLQRG